MTQIMTRDDIVEYLAADALGSKEFREKLEGESMSQDEINEAIDVVLGGKK